MASQARETLAATESLCPVCLQRLDATVVSQSGTVYLEKRCPEHGFWQVPVWRGEPSYQQWQRPKAPSAPEVCYAPVKDGCPFDCGLCADHRQYPCSVLLEVTKRCSLGCPVCFAAVGEETCHGDDPELATIDGWYDRVMAAAGNCNIQLSGGEPTQRDDLPAIIALGRRKGFDFIQVNSNGLRLAGEAGYARTLAEAGLSTVFLQFDGTSDSVYSRLRGRPLMAIKEAAIRNCGEAGLGVVLVPTLVPGVNIDEIGAIIRFALTQLQVVRGVHFQPISYFGRYALDGSSLERFTLPEVMQAIEAQTEGLMRVGDFVPPGGENARCSFHGSFFQMPNGRLRRTTSSSTSCCGTNDGHEGLLRTIGTVARQWSAPPGGASGAAKAASTMDAMDAMDGTGVSGAANAAGEDGVLDLDAFLARATNYSLTVSCMVFQDVWNLNLERLRDCCISIMSPEGMLVPFCAYNLTSADGTPLYRTKEAA